MPHIGEPADHTAGTSAWNVLSTRWPVARPEDDLGRRPIRQLADGDHLGVLPQERAQAGLERDPAPGFTCGLCDAGTATSIGSSSVATAALAGRLCRPASRRQA